MTYIQTCFKAGSKWLFLFLPKPTATYTFLTNLFPWFFYTFVCILFVSVFLFCPTCYLSFFFLFLILSVLNLILLLEFDTTNTFLRSLNIFYLYLYFLLPTRSNWKCHNLFNTFWKFLIKFRVLESIFSLSRFLSILFFCFLNFSLLCFCIQDIVMNISYGMRKERAHWQLQPWSKKFQAVCWLHHHTKL